MVAHVPIPPRRAAGLVDHAQVGPPADVLADFAAAGLVKAYARLQETVHCDGRREEVRDKRISRETWRRVIAEGRVEDIATGTVRLGGSAEFGGGSR